MSTVTIVEFQTFGAREFALPPSAMIDPATAATTLFGAAGAPLAVQTLPIGEGALSAPFQTGTDLLCLVPDQACSIAFGESPTPIANGIAVSVPMFVEPGGARLAVA